MLSSFKYGSLLVVKKHKYGQTRSFRGSGQTERSKLNLQSSFRDASNTPLREPPPLPLCARLPPRSHPRSLRRGKVRSTLCRCGAGRATPAHALALPSGLDRFPINGARDAPIKDAIELDVLAVGEPTEECAEAVVVREVAELEPAHVFVEDVELGREADGKHGLGFKLLIANEIPGLADGGALDFPPREGAAEEVDEHVREPFEVVSPRALDAEMGVDCGEETGAHAMMLVLVIGDVGASSRVAELFCEAKVDDIDDVVFAPRLCAFGHDEVCGFDVAVDKIVRMYVLDAGDLRQTEISKAIERMEDSGEERR